MDLTPYNNGVHSLAEGLKCLHQFLKNEKDPYLMKEVVIKVHHGLETLLKDLLFQRNPIFLLVEKTNVSQILEFYKGFYEGKNNYLFDDAKTITPEEAISRIKDLKIISGISNKDYQQLTASFKTLNAVRNQLQHFAIKANPDEIIRVLGNLIPRAVGILKAYYSSEGRNPYQTKVDLIPHQPLPGMEQLFVQAHDVDRDLNHIYSDATNVISQIEAKYDHLLNEAISKLQGTISKNLQLVFKLRDHGHVGAPPYLPEITLEGWLREKFEPHRNSLSTRFYRPGEQITATYNSSLDISQPQALSRGDNWHQDSITKLNISCETTIDVLDSAIFDILELNEFLPFIKSPKLNILMQIECTSSGMFNEHHFYIRTITELKGSLKVELISSVFGDPDMKPSVRGIQDLELNEENTSLSFHAFVESNNKLRDHHSLEIKVDAASDIVFEKP
tara:strand:+ start:417 stop:1757 length:1341 start_codon:yes stop_codon:yes gene_type:complete